MRTFRHETALFLLALIIGLTIRLIGLGAQPLSDEEAKWALQAWNAARGVPIQLGSNVAYVSLTSGLFFVFGGASTALARLIPALAGSALIAIPLLFRERLKPRPAVILAFAFALEPGLAALSRQAGSPILGVVFTLAAWGFWEQRKLSWAGAFAGLALISGPILWPGLLGLALAWALLRPFASRNGAPTPTKRRAPASPNRDWITLAAYALGSIIIIGTGFMTAPGGLSSWIASAPEYISGWTRLSDLPLSLLPLSVLLYQPLGLLLALVAGVAGWVQGRWRARQLSVWMLVAFFLALLYSSHQVADLVWMLIPMWALASLQIARALNVPGEDRREVLGAIGLSFLILVFMWMDFLSLRRPGIPGDQVQLRIWLLAGSFLLLAVSLLLVAVGWSQRIAKFGALWGLAAFLSVYSGAMLMAAAGHRRVPNSAEMWQPGAQLPMANLLFSTVRDQSVWSGKDANEQPVVIT
ncbi:MAG TPA: hypothetical protein VFH29_03700, partial [Anaerolineales bacterium]|nr:hypothetical protein [Anaerolineales bacterium]